MRPRPRPCSDRKLSIYKKIHHTEWYGVFLTGNYLSSQAASSQVLSTYGGLTTVFGMGTGGSPQLSPPDDDCAYYLGANLFATLIIVPQANAFFRPSRRKNTNRHLEGRNPQNFTEEKTNEYFCLNLHVSACSLKETRASSLFSRLLCVNSTL